MIINLNRNKLVGTKFGSAKTKWVVMTASIPMFFNLLIGTGSDTLVKIQWTRDLESQICVKESMYSASDS